MVLGTFPSERQTELAWRKILRGDPCAYCGDRSGVVEHIVPMGMGGPPDWENTTAACHDCNSRKGSKTMLAFIHGGAIGHDNWSRQHERDRIRWAQEGGYMMNFLAGYRPW